MINVHEETRRLLVVANHIMRVFEKERGKPFSHRQLREEMLKRNWGHHPKSIKRAVDYLFNRGRIGRTQIGKIDALYANLEYPFLDNDVDELARSGQYPLYLIVAKMQDVGFPRINPPEKPGKEGERTRDLMKRAKEEICWWAGDFSRISELRPSIKEALDNSVDFKILMNVNPFSLKNAESILELIKEKPENLRVRHWVSEWRGSIFDGSIVRLVEKHPLTPEARMKMSTGAPGTEEEYRYMVWHIDSSKNNLRTWVSWLRSVWEDHWQIAGRGPRFSSVIETLSAVAPRKKQ